MFVSRGIPNTTILNVYWEQTMNCEIDFLGMNLRIFCTQAVLLYGEVGGKVEGIILPLYCTPYIRYGSSSHVQQNGLL